MPCVSLHPGGEGAYPASGVDLALGVVEELR